MTESQSCKSVSDAPLVPALHGAKYVYTCRVYDHPLTRVIRLLRGLLPGQTPESWANTGLPVRCDFVVKDCYFRTLLRLHDVDPNKSWEENGGPPLPGEWQDYDGTDSRG